MRIIGLTGGIASGKSTVARMLERYGVPIVDADQLAREAVIPGQPAYVSIVKEFGVGVLHPDRTLDRGRLGKIVFDDDKARKILERILHPAIGRLAEQRLKQLEESGVEVAVYMAPLLIEAGIVSRVDEVWVVYVAQETQLVRIMERDKLTKEDALKRIASQMPMEEKARYGRVVIDNSDTLQETERLIKAIWDENVRSSGAD